MEVFCGNCGRDARVEGEVVVKEGRAYCGHNCYWSKMLDSGNSRLRIKKRHVSRFAGHVVSNKEMNTSNVIHDPILTAINPNATMAEYGHAIFQFHSGFTDTQPFQIPSRAA
mmetsp:Transcript_11512/g.11533  ORF Transcript_11512/g.11533 Transcript_11512/m.11533 type:complete len:112 (-) Transcript_11512:153-488(-)